MNKLNIDYEYYFAKGYESKEQIEHLEKNSSVPSRATPETLSPNWENSKILLRQDIDKSSKLSDKSAVAAIAGETFVEGRTTSGAADYQVFISAQPADTTLLNKFQLDFLVFLLPAGLDPYNPDEIDISVKFRHSRHGAYYVNAYWGKDYERHLCATPDPTGVSNMYVNGPTLCQPQSLHPFNIQAITSDGVSGDPAYLEFTGEGWHARFAPPAVGEWTYSFLIGLNGGTKIEYYGDFSSFNVGPSANRGYIGAHKRNFKFTGPSTDIYIPMGCVAEGIIAPNFDRAVYAMCINVIEKLAANNGNLIRLWCTYEQLGIECGNNGWTAGNYDYGQDRAFDLDGVIEYAEQKGVYVQLILDEKGFFVPSLSDINWFSNPYAQFISDAYTGTFGTFPFGFANYQKYASGLFFTDETCRKFYKRKLRYTMARWGYSTNVFAFEFMNEVTTAGVFFVDWNLASSEPSSLLTWQGTNFLDYVDWALSDHWKAPGYIQVINWVNEMIDYCKNECYQGNNHMFTISAPDSESNYPNDWNSAEHYDPNDFVNSMNIDFYTSHFYDTTQFTDYRINFLANRANYLYPDKPFLIGEYWLHPSNCDGQLLFPLDGSGNPTGYVLTYSFLNGSPHNNHLYNCADFHNALFASVLSGCSGAVQPYDFGIVGTAYGGQLAYYKPLSAFLQGEDLDWSNCVAIRNDCNKTDFEIVDQIMPTTAASNFGDNHLADSFPSIFHVDIIASGLYFRNGAYLETNLVEVFALKYIQGLNEGKIIGWVKNSYNWWLNLPHWGDTNTLYQSPYLAYRPSSENPYSFTSIYNVEITINNIRWNGVYQIDFYSVYPDWPLVPGGPGAENGGIIASSTASTYCNTLTINVPFPLDALKYGQGPIAPDYGFKATLLYKTWGYGFLGPLPYNPYHASLDSAPTGLQTFAVGNGSKLLAYANSERQLMFYTRHDVGDYEWFQWNKNNFTDINSNFKTSVDCVVALGANDSQIFYKGADGTLQCAYPDESAYGGWGWGSTGEHVYGDIGCAANGGKVFFRGNDGDLHMLLWNDLGGPWAWRHYNFTASMGVGYNQKPHPTTNFSVSADGGLIAYRTNEGKLAVIYEVSPWVYSYSWVNEHVNGMVRVNGGGDVIFYTDLNNNLRVYYWGGASWVATSINTTSGPVHITGPFDIIPEQGFDNEIFFQGSDGYVHVAFQESGQWVQGHIFCWSEPASRKCMNANALIRFNNGAVFYQGVMASDNSISFDNFRAYYYGKGDVEDI